MIVVINTEDANKRRIPLPEVVDDSYATITDGTGIKASLMYPDNSKVTTNADIVIDATDGHVYVQLTQGESDSPEEGVGSICVPAAAGRLLTGPVPVTFMTQDVYAAQVEVEPESVRDAIGMANADLDSQLAALPTAAENAAEILSEAQATPIHAAMQSAAADSITADALASDAVAEIQDGLATSAEVGDLPTLTEIIAGEIAALDGLSNGATTVTINGVSFTVTRTARDAINTMTAD